MEMEEGQLQPSSAKVKVDKRLPINGMIGAARFTPKLELTKIHVAPVTLRRLKATTRFKALDDHAKEALEESSSTRSSESVIVSYPLTESLQRFIAKAMRRRREQQLASPKRSRNTGARRAPRERSVLSRKKLNPRQQKMKKVATRRALPYKRVRKTQTAATKAPAGGEACSEESPDRLGKKKTAEIRCRSKRDLDKETGPEDDVLEIQPDAICTVQDLNKKRIAYKSKVVVPDASDLIGPRRETKRKKLRISNKKTSKPSVTRSRVATRVVGKKRDRKVKKNGASSLPAEHDGFNSSESLVSESEPPLGQGPSGSVPIVSGSQIEVETEMDVITTSVAELASERVSTAPGTVSPPTNKMAAKSGLDSNLLVLDNSDFGTVVEQITLASSSDQTTEGTDGGESLNSALAKTKGWPEKQPRKTKQVRKLIISPKQFVGGSHKSKASTLESGSRLSESVVSKIKKQQTKEPKMKDVPLIKLSPVLETRGEPKRLSSSKSGRCSTTKKEPIIRVTKSAEEIPVPVKKTRGRPRKYKPDKDKEVVPVKKVVPMKEIVPVKKQRGRPRKLKPCKDKAPVPGSETKLSPCISEVEQSVSEDSGYPSSCTNSRSPTECVLTSPIILKSEVDFLNEESFQEVSSPILRDSNLSTSKPDVDGSQILEANPSTAETEFKLNLGMESGFTMGESMGMDVAQSSTQNIFHDLDMLLGQDLNPDQLFNLDGNSDSTLGAADEVEDILRSPSVSSCLKDLQLAGSLTSTEVVQPMQLFSSTQPASTEHLPIDKSSESSQLAPNKKATESDNTTKVDSCNIVANESSQSITESEESVPAIPLKSKSGRKLKRTWKLCTEKEKNTEAEDLNPVEKPIRRVIRIVKKKPSCAKETTGKLSQKEPRVCLGEPPSAAPPPSVKGTGEPMEGGSDAVTMNTEITASGLTQSLAHREQMCQNVKKRVTSVTHPRPGTLATDSPCVKKTGADQPEKDRKLSAVKTTALATSPSLRSFKLNLKKHSISGNTGSSCSSESYRPDGDKAGLPSSNTSPGVNAMKEPTPVEEVNPEGLSSVAESGREEEKASKVSKRDVESSQVFTFNGFLPPASVSDKNHLLFSGGKTPPSGIFNRGLGRVGSIFANAETSNGQSSNKTVSVSSLNNQPSSLNSQPNSNTATPQAVADTPPTSTSLSKHKLRLPSSNSLSMSLDTVLKQMGGKKESKSKTRLIHKKALHLHGAMESSSSSPCGRKDPAPALEGPKVIFGEIQYKSPPALNTSFADSAISDLILAPLNVGETLDDELNGESLFATNATDSVEVDQSKDKLCREEVASTPAVKEEGQDENMDDRTNQLGLRPGVEHKGESEVRPKVKKEVVSPPMMKTIRLSVADKDQQGDEMEDCIDLFPDADDLLGEDVGEEPLAKVFVRSTRFSSDDVSGLKGKKDLPHSRRCHSPVPLDDGGFKSSFDKAPAAVPFKSQQVSQWVADQRKRRESFPTKTPLAASSSSPALGSGGRLLLKTPSSLLLSQRVGNSHSQDNGCPNSFMATSLPKVRSTSNQDSDSGYNTMARISGPPPPQKYCKYYLLQRSCPLRMCRFAHCQRDQAPPRIVEEMVFRQPLEKIYVEEMKPYVADQRSYYILINNFSSFVDMMRALLDKRCVAVINHFTRLNSISGVKFSTSFLCRLMEMCASQYPSSLHSSCPDVLSTGEKLLVAIEDSRGHLISEDYHFFISSLVKFKETRRLSGIYRAMNSREICPTTSTLFILLRFVKTLDDSVLPLLLSDVKSSQFSAVEKASYVSHLVVSVDPVRLELHSVAFGEWLAESPNDITTNLSSRCCDLLCGVFAKKGQWSNMVALFAGCPRYISELGSRVCECLRTALQRVGPVSKLISVAEILSEDQIVRMSSEFWETVLLECAKQKRSQKVSFICSTLYQHKKFLSMETVIALTEMLLDQDNFAAAISVFMESLQHDSSITLSGNLLVSVSQAMEKIKDTNNLYTLVKLLMDQGISPPPAVQESVLTLCVAEKQCHKLADLLKLANLKGVALEKGFCQKALVELRHWGRDPDSISAAYKFLRKFDGVGEGSIERLSAGAAPSPVSKLNHTLLRVCRSTSFSSPVPSPPPPPPTPPLMRSQSLTDEPDNVRSLSSTPTNVAYQTVFATDSDKTDFSSIFKLIEENGSNGQFGAVASILANLPDLTDECASKAVFSVWKGIVSADQRSVNCFSELLKSLDQHRAAARSHSSTECCKPGSSLLAKDRWMISQVGIALLKGYDRTENWQSGFLLLHYLHFHGIHYVKFSQPPSNLPPFVPHAPSPCEVALLSVKLCLQVDQVDGALEVLRGCDWVKVSTDEELKKRTEMLCGVTKKCLDKKKLQEAWKCLDNIDCAEIKVECLNVITNLHNRLLQDVLALRETSFALSIHSKMKHCKLQCLPTVFSALLQHLCEKKQVKHARDLCKTAISEEAYSPLATNDQFKIYLSPGLVGVELHLLIENHLRSMVSEVDKDHLKPLTIQFFAGSRQLVELVLSKFIKPPLQATFTSTNFATVSVPCIQQWCSANCWDRGKEYSARGDQPPSPAALVGQKRHFSELDNAEGSQDALEIKEASSEGVCGASNQDATQPQQGNWKDFKRAVCNAVMSKIKPFYKEKFSSEEDYLHLFRVLTQNCSRLYKGSISEHFQAQPGSNRKECVLSDSVLCKIAELVTDLMSRCKVYSRDLDEELGLTSGFSSD